VKKFFATTMLSMGMPMILMGERGPPDAEREQQQ
jgi:hypothetical protein